MSGGDQLHVLQVSDKKQAWFHRASEADDADPFSPVISLVAREIERLGVQPARVATLGFCCGAYAAVRVGLGLGAARVLAFSPQVYIHPDERRDRQLLPAYFDHTLESLRDAGACPLDSLVSVLRKAAPRLSSRNDAVLVELHIGADAVEDVQEVLLFTEELRELDPDVLLNVSVSVHTHPGCGHAVPYCLRNAGTLQELLWGHLCGLN